VAVTHAFQRVHIILADLVVNLKGVIIAPHSKISFAINLEFHTYTSLYAFSASSLFQVFSNTS